MARLGDVCTFQSGGTPSRSNSAYFDGTIPWITTVALNGSAIDENSAVEWITDLAISESAAKIVPVNSIMVGTRVGVGKVAINKVSMSTSQDIISLLHIDETQWYKPFLCKFILAKSDYLNSQARGATIKGIKIDVLAALELPDMQIDQQKRIAAILDQTEVLLSLRKQQLAKLDELVKSRFVEMFGDPVTNEKNWPRLTLGDICEIGSSKRVFEKDYVPSGIPFFRTKEIVELSKGNPISTELFITEEHFAELKKSYGAPKKDDLLISAVGTIGTIWIVSGDFEFYFKDGNLIQIKSSPTFNSIFMKYLLDELIANYKKEMSTGTAYSALTIAGLKKMLVYDVPLEFQKKFAAFVEQSDKSKLSIQQSITQLETLKASLMQQYFR